MKYSILPFVALLLFSCGGNSDQSSAGNYTDITISMDTVVVDSGDEILMAATNPYGHSYSRDARRLYYWDGRSAGLEIVDLDNFQLLAKKTFETEGPNGVGKDAYQSCLAGEDRMAFSDWNQVVITDFEGNVKDRIKLSDEWITANLDDTSSLSLLGFSDDWNWMYCEITNFSKLNSNIVKVDWINKTTDLIELPEFDKRENFRVTFKSASNGGTSMSMVSPSLDLEKNREKVIFWSDAFTNVYTYDAKNDSLKFELIISSLTANEKMGTYKNDVSSYEAMSEEISKINLEVSFSKLLWDDKNKIYYRFSSYNLPKIADEDSKSRVFLSIISENFEMMVEKEVSNLFKTVPAAQFVKDGLIYCFLNVNDELGYVRIKAN
ncbi:DUF4221 domain-containing protein [Belliella sp. DSM 111904]|uniref:DUF4221 domain-containing protein n=1 Tax=Belliella filtrata TaxID=2923435 RepID=A0ABS9V485_9BACT|nr:DUF4221 family protein [Belliella filtrata]MCH7410783.1 DUF4221 domain-containing protein [Belliella filtrata]